LSITSIPLLRPPLSSLLTSFPPYSFHLHFPTPHPHIHSNPRSLQIPPQATLRSVRLTLFITA
ncbi:MAG: hypothetical protein K2J65_00200, partial [Duncaniella sp.]|nr:hypothetical protein [Duncaniella sp.]